MGEKGRATTRDWYDNPTVGGGGGVEGWRGGPQQGTGVITYCEGGGGGVGQGLGGKGDPQGTGVITLP